jgi:hypothetical protein
MPRTQQLHGTPFWGRGDRQWGSKTEKCPGCRSRDGWSRASSTVPEHFSGTEVQQLGGSRCHAKWLSLHLLSTVVALRAAAMSGLVSPLPAGLDSPWPDLASAGPEIWIELRRVCEASHVAVVQFSGRREVKTRRQDLPSRTPGAFLPPRPMCSHCRERALCVVALYRLNPERSVEVSRGANGL